MFKGTGNFLHPEKVLDQLDLEPGMKVADFGCGHGYFAIPLAKAVGAKGKVYALDVLKESLEAVKSKAATEEVSNIETIRGNLELNNGSKLKDSSIDIVFLAKILFQSQKKIAMVLESKRVLKPGGQLVIIDWLAKTALAPKEGWLIAKEEIKELTEAEGFNFDKELEVDDLHYGLVFIKS